MYPCCWKIECSSLENLSGSSFPRESFPFPRSNFPFSRSGLSDLATLGQTTVRSRKRKNSLSEKKVRLRVFPSQSNVFPATRNIYSSRMVSLGQKINFFYSSGLLMAPLGNEFIPTFEVQNIGNEAFQNASF